MVSRALRIVGLLLLVCGTSAAQSYDGQGWLRQGPPRQGQPGQGQPRHALHRVPVSAPQAMPAHTPRTGAAHAQRRDAAGRTWSDVDLGARHSRSADGNTWTTQRFGSWSYSYASDGTSCVSRRAAQTVFISCH